MKYQGWEMESAVHESIKHTPYTFSGGLLQNDESITFQVAKEHDSLIILRWRIRQCISCSQRFDITSEGLLYKCGECVR